jgi:hypothetical protein
MTDQPAWLLPDGRVVLERRGASLCVLALEAAVRSDRRNGRPPGRDLVRLAAVLAAAVQRLAAVLPEVQECWSAARAEAGLARRVAAGRFWLSSRQVEPSPGPPTGASAGPVRLAACGPAGPRVSDRVI